MKHKRAVEQRYKFAIRLHKQTGFYTIEEYINQLIEKDSEKRMQKYWGESVDLHDLGYKIKDE
jgi:hypothetical protein